MLTTEEAALIEAYRQLSQDEKLYIFDFAIESAKDRVASRPKLTLISSSAANVLPDALSRQLG